jgi:hypothetical protein
MNSSDKNYPEQSQAAKESIERIGKKRDLYWIAK